MRRWLIVFAGLVFLGIAAAGAYKFVFSGDESKPAGNNVSRKDQKTSDSNKIRLVASGDMLPHDTVNLRAKTNGGYDYIQFFNEVRPVFDGADINFCNQESLSSGEPFGISGYPSFNAPAQFAKDLNAAGCNLISLANNHINDKGQAAINATLDVWDDLDTLAVAGANRNAEEHGQVRYFTVKGVRFAFVAYAEYSNNRNLTAYGLNLLNEQLVRAQLGEARAQADFMIISVHWGSEYSPNINNFQDGWANTFAELGADIVIGHGPHVLQPVKRLPKAGGGETLVWYSLGNMLSTQLETEALIGGFAIMDIDTKTKQLTDARFLPTYMHYEWTAAQKAREDLLTRHNLMIYPLDKAAEPLSRSLHNTTVQAQTERVKNLLNQFTTIPVDTSDDYN